MATLINRSLFVISQGEARAPVPSLGNRGFKAASVAAGSLTGRGEGEIGLHTRAEEKNPGITNQPLDYVSSLQKGPKLERCNRSVASSRLKIDFLTICYEV